MNVCAQKSEGGTVTALLLAVHGGRDEEVESLLAAGVDVNVADADGLTPLMASAMNDSFMIARQLLDAGADPSTCNKWDMTAHDIAAFHGHNALAALLAERLHAAEAGKQFAPSPELLPAQNQKMAH